MSVSDFKASAFPTQDLEKQVCTPTVGNLAKETAAHALDLGSHEDLILRTLVKPGTKS